MGGQETARKNEQHKFNSIKWDIPLKKFKNRTFLFEAICCCSFCHLQAPIQQRKEPISKPILVPTPSAPPLYPYHIIQNNRWVYYNMEMNEWIHICHEIILPHANIHSSTWYPNCITSHTVPYGWLQGYGWYWPFTLRHIEEMLLTEGLKSSLRAKSNTRWWWCSQDFDIRDQHFEWFGVHSTSNWMRGWRLTWIWMWMPATEWDGERWSKKNV